MMSSRGKYYGYDHEDMEAAIVAVEDRTMTLYRAAESYGVPRTTLMGYIHHTSTLGKRGEAPLFLEQTEDERLSTYIKWMADHGWGLTSKQVC